eukprot:scaffold297485_cov27-Tisochrysis_lutea.AAC.4
MPARYRRRPTYQGRKEHTRCIPILCLPRLRCIYEAHCAGSLVIGLDLGCTLLGHSGIVNSARSPGSMCDSSGGPLETGRDKVGGVLAGGDDSSMDGDTRCGLGLEPAEDSSAPVSGSKPVSEERIAEISFECLADDVPYDANEMTAWPEEQIYAFFENVRRPRRIRSDASWACSIRHRARLRTQKPSHGRAVSS